MATIYELARTLGEELLKTPEVEKLLEAKKVYEADTEAVRLMEEYTAIQKEYQQKMAEGQMEEKEQKAVTKDLMDRAAVIKANTAAAALFEAENTFNSLMNSVFSIVTSTMAGEQSSAGCSGGCCSSCGGGCH